MPWDHRACQVIYEESCWHPRYSDITGVLATESERESEQERERERERERGSWRHYRIKQLRSPLASSASLFMWLSGLGLRQNQTPAGHLMIERISELIGRCRGIWTQMTRGTLGCTDRHTRRHTIPIHTRIERDIHKHTNTRVYTVTQWLLE